MRHRKDDGVGGREIVLQGEAVFPQRRRRIGERIVNLHRHAERLKLANDVDDLRIADIDDVFLEGQSQHGHSLGAGVPAFNRRRRHSRATRTPMESLMRRPARITSGWYPAFCAR